MITGYEGFEVPGEKYTTITTHLATNSGVQDVFIAQDRYALLATGSGIDIVDLFSGEVVSSGTILGTETTSVVAEWTTVTGNMYVGTTTGGVYSTLWHPLRSPGLDFSDRLQQAFTDSSTPAISDNHVHDLAIAANPSRLLVSTASGVDFIVKEASSATRPLLSGSLGCQLTSAGEGYWIATNSGAEVNYDLISTTGAGIISVDFEYNAVDSNPKLHSNWVADISVVAGTPNLLGFATSAGDFIVEEQQGAEATSLTKSGSSEDIVSMDFSSTATYDTGTEYVTTTGFLTVFELVADTVIGTHYQEIPIQDKFDKENTRDQALVTGTIAVIRTTGVA